MAVVIRDAGVEGRVRTERLRSDAARWDECWSGVLIIPPSPNTDHQQLVLDFCSVFLTVINRQRGDRCLPGANVSDRDDDWTFNFRVPDVVVVLRTGRAVDRGTHWVGGPDLIVEIISPDEEPHAKLDFHESIGAREVLVLQRNPWLLERFSLRDGKLACVEKCSPGEGSVACDVVPVTFAIPQAGQLSAQAAGRTWTF